ncbi:MAG: MOSC domain-containing protein [Deltaproteobacteria bacterium]|nr:MOSC domain-containing protein [Deltaproteobacteria bacterium]MBW2015873.1 MOSC domain-containing protein [Deltaproteobacteria bacterium]MBW2129626.1 MOSC domain-containing protein [Deltaproteobacteria bacterium]MBW2303950.1 MOSC domain-containing protein [Deltaproteobacteria bacterium]
MRVVSIAVSKKKGTGKIPVREAEVVINHGIRGDAHAGSWHRQVSFLASEQIEQCRARGLDVDFGDFAENIATEGVDWKQVPVGSKVRIGDAVILEITQIGKECRKKCAIYYQAGDCIMPREGTFARVLKGGAVRVGDSVKIEKSRIP